MSGNTIGSFTVVDGTDAGNAVNDVIEMLPTAAWGQDLSDALMAEHGRTGLHDATKVAMLAGTQTFTGAKTLPSPTFTGSVTYPTGNIPTAALAAAAVTAAKMQYGMIAQRQGGTSGDATWATAGTSNTDTSAKGIILQTGAVTTSGSSGVTVTFPTAYTQIPIVLVGSTHDSNGYWATVSTVTTTNCSVAGWSATGTLHAHTAFWLAIGQ